MSCINLLFDGEWLSIANGLICGNDAFRPAISLVSLEVPRVTPCSTWNLPRDSSSFREVGAAESLDVVLQSGRRRHRV